MLPAELLVINAVNHSLQLAVGGYHGVAHALFGRNLRDAGAAMAEERQPAGFQHLCRTLVAPLGAVKSLKADIKPVAADKPVYIVKQGGIFRFLCLKMQGVGNAVFVELVRRNAAYVPAAVKQRLYIAGLVKRNERAEAVLPHRRIYHAGIFTGAHGRGTHGYIELGVVVFAAGIALVKHKIKEPYAALFKIFVIYGIAEVVKSDGSGMSTGGEILRAQIKFLRMLITKSVAVLACQVLVACEIRRREHQNEHGTGGSQIAPEKRIFLSRQAAEKLVLIFGKTVSANVFKRRAVFLRGRVYLKKLGNRVGKSFALFDAEL